MRILIASAFTAFAPPGADDRAADALAEACRAHRPGDPVARLRLPAGDHLAAAARLTDVTEYAERLVCVGAGAAPLRHPGRRVWVLGDPGPDAEALRSACAGALAVRATDAAAVGALRAAGVEAAPLPLPGPGASWAGVVEALVA